MRLPARSHVLTWLVAAILSMLSLLGSAQEIIARSAALELEDENYALRADFDIALTPVLEDALVRGVALYFLMELDVWRERRWWLDKQVVHSALSRKLSFNSLTRQYRLATGGLYQNFQTLDEALRALGRVRSSSTVAKEALAREGVYLAQVRMSLDVSQLPGLFQVDALASPEWHLNSVAYSWTITH